MTPLNPAGRFLLVLIAGLCLALAPTLGAQAPPAPSGTSASAPKVKELIGLMQSKKLEAIAAKDPEGSGRYVAALHIPGVQLLVVSAAYEKPSELDSRIYYKDFMNAYVDLNTSVHSSDKTFIEDALCDGLIALPGKSNLARDAVKLGTEEQVFDGDFAGPNQRNSKKVSHEVYQKRFSAAEERYVRVLGLLIEEMKKMSASLASDGSLR
jgi:hypothetical protein